MECQDFVQVGTMQGEARAYVAPHRGYVDVGQQVAAVVADALVWDQCRMFHHGGFEIKGTQRLRGVAREIDSSPARAQEDSRSTTSGANPRCRSARAAPRPAIPAPTTRMRKPEPLSLLGR